MFARTKKAKAPGAALDPLSLNLYQESGRVGRAGFARVPAATRAAASAAPKPSGVVTSVPDSGQWYEPWVAHESVSFAASAGSQKEPRKGSREARARGFRSNSSGLFVGSGRSGKK